MTALAALTSALCASPLAMAPSSRPSQRTHAPSSSPSRHASLRLSSPTLVFVAAVCPSVASSTTMPACFSSVAPSHEARASSVHTTRALCAASTTTTRRERAQSKFKPLHTHVVRPVLTDPASLQRHDTLDVPVLEVPTGFPCQLHAPRLCHQRVHHAVPSP